MADERNVYGIMTASNGSAYRLQVPGPTYLASAVTSSNIYLISGVAEILN